MLPTQNETKINVPKSDGNQENEVDPTKPNKQRNQDHGDQSYEENAVRTHTHTHARTDTHPHTHAHTRTHMHAHTRLTCMHIHARTQIR